MRSNYKRLGDYIELVDERNTELSVDLLLGLTIEKKFIPSVANIVGTNMKNYKIIRKNQFACSTMQVRRDKKMPVAILKDFEEAIISQAYPVFQVMDESLLDPDYLMMWFTRAEFDRQATFHAVGGVRGSLEWEDFLDFELPIPYIEKQREIVEEYNTVTNRIKLNEQLNQKLEETAQALYKHWFVDFEFPNEEGKPYKSSGGAMVYNEELDKEIPVGWEVKSFTEKFKLGGGGTPKTNEEKYWNGDILFFTPADRSESYYCIETEKKITIKGLNESSTKIYPKDTVFITARGTVGAISIAGFSMAMNQSCYSINGDNKFFAHQTTLDAIKKLKKEAVGAVFNALVTKDFDSQSVINPSFDVEEKFETRISIIYEVLLSKLMVNQKLSELQSVLLSKMSRVEKAISNKKVLCN
ncbi:restriction endonuclease subunit S [Arenibacter lacus]|uniref:restriction endonuclease subunit S n=1 Tax=Arenibacter lacus TaxID=2608629 RepID=UPI00123D7F34|nr:restriction endonuclease subunit S [Arenibacter lacus]